MNAHLNDWPARRADRLTVTSKGIVIGGGYVRPAPAPSADAETIQRAMLGWDYRSHAVAEAADQVAISGASEREQQLAARAVYWACALGAVVSLGVAVFR